ncbi:M23 family metallopeptidase [Sphingomonas quercus]|uniref:M23 family metallopeptidase n=1 Tax=Sphingomonas quercus TaxID=2842451 RepID=A0ABS6BFQ8_9SPHN|nr:M23 family metallopeptidase [Sphingomonas quercus]MBU3077128.1 M23 family metallopeptidase [Sphingomonas quercus]
MLAAFRSHVVARALLILSAFSAVSAPAFAATTDRAPDVKFRSLFDSWKRLDQVDTAANTIAIPSQKPLQEEISLSSSFGVRSDPFRHTAAMHAGLDMPGKLGTPVYATADGVVARAEWANGYGKLIEIDHGKGIATRYGHLSEIMVEPNTRVHRGDMIGRMGSTGRSTGSHLHYEVRIDGRAVNPMPFLEGDDYMLALNRLDAQPTNGQVALGGPEVGAPDDAENEDVN